MMYGSFGWGWMSLGIVLLLLILAALIVLIVRVFTMGTSRATGTGPAAPGSARQIAEERLARGEISPEEFGQIVRALERPS
ncbi:SHOCT domain-containing protein [Microbacterium cremeum]|uniref:SHOCT domain-containing protein n=1 Tax=Microbacterium cremeum TaxID=2782169 RepID=UPI001887F2CD|nr:SHOCT domain-containing protein [Microbacterium cremeum]